MSSTAKVANVGLDLSERVAVVSGGTQGIGASTALRFAQAGASVYVIGRNEKLGNAVVDELKRIGGDGKTYEFIKADLSLMSSVKETAATLQAKTGAHGIDYLVETQGGPPNGVFKTTSEGHEFHFAVQLLSRFGLAYLLAKNGTLKESFVSVCAPSGTAGKQPDLEDLDLMKMQQAGKWRLSLLAASAARDSNVMDGIMAQFPRMFPHLKAYHVFPGVVTSNAAENSGFPYPVVALARLFAPVIERTIGNSPTTYSEIPVYLAANPKSQGQNLEFSNERLKPVSKAAWLDDETKTKALWDRMVDIGGF
ncbi:protein of glucose/ribitol dehydrogenase family [Pseudohyphozyma bogoriensis]|nr:protein of glucose/ribitol dehydrogenase family [Pseudohyphozyma bogoriensis]